MHLCEGVRRIVVAVTDRHRRRLVEVECLGGGLEAEAEIEDDLELFERKLSHRVEN